MTKALRKFVRAIADHDESEIRALLRATPSLVHDTIVDGATRAAPSSNYLDPIQHYVYAGDTALHIAAAAYNGALVRTLIERGASVRARNRRGAEPLHYAADGSPTFETWDPIAQADVVKCLVRAGADPNALDKSGVAPLHRAVRVRTTGAVRALLTSGANPHLTNKSGSAPLDLALKVTGRGGSGADASKRECERIVRLLEAALRA